MSGFIQENAYAILVGADYYASSLINDLPTVAQDVKAVAEVLTDPVRCGYASDKVTVYTGKEATVENFRNSLRRIVVQTNEESTVLIYFSGHGLRVRMNDSWIPYFCFYDTVIHGSTTTGLSANEFSELIKAIPASRLIIFIDACHAAGLVQLKGEMNQLKQGFADSDYVQLSRGRGRVVVSSSSEEQVSYIKPTDGVSLFTKYLCRALNGEAAIRNDGLIRIFDVFHFVSEAVQEEEHRQTPLLKVNDVNLNFAIAINPNNQKSVSVLSQSHPVEAIRREIIRQGIHGVRLLSQYVAATPNTYTLRGEVDGWLAQLEEIEQKLRLFGPNNNDQAAKNRIIYLLLELCVRLERNDWA